MVCFMFEIFFICNIVFICELDLEFGFGFWVFIGEIGVGKLILFDFFGLVFGVWVD